MTNELLQEGKLSNKDIKELYRHCTILANSKYKEPIKVLQSRNIGYSVDDFVQETMQIVLDSLTKKSFKSLQKLKSFAYKTMEFHYLKEKRKYFYTKQRGSMQCVSIEDKVLPVHGEAGQNFFSEYLEDPKSHIDIDKLALQDLQKRDLQVAIKGNMYSLVEAEYLDKLPDMKNTFILSVNHFINLQYSIGFKESCRYYKSKGFNMTRTIYNNINIAIMSYLYRNNLLEKPVVEKSKIEHKHVMSNPIKSNSLLEKIMHPMLV